jgi:uncharacterized protein (DUF4415 family)
MPGKRNAPSFDDENPEWTEEDFVRSRPAHEVLPPEVLASFKKARGPQKAPTKVLVSIRLNPEVVEHFRATGSGWQSRINDLLKDAIEQGRA